MKYLILSDIHGSLPRLNKALKVYDTEHCDMLIILGDIINYGPRNSIPDGIDGIGIAEKLNGMAENIVAIRGNCDSEVDQMLLHFPIMSDYTILVDDGRRILLTHGHKYNPDNLPPGKWDAVFYGHTHIWQLERKNSTTICNTGSITFPKGGNMPTMAIMDNGHIRIVDIDGNTLKER